MSINKDEMVEGLGTKEPPLKHNAKAFEKKNVVKSISVYNVPKKIIEAIESHAATFSSYAKFAIEEKLRRDGWLKD